MTARQATQPVLCLPAVIIWIQQAWTWREVRHGPAGSTQQCMRDAQANVAAGLCSGTGAAIVGQPLDTIRTRLQVPRLGYKSVYACASDTVRRAGVRGLWAGLSTQLVALPLMQSLGFSTFGASLRCVFL